MDQKVTDGSQRSGSGRLPAEEAARLPDRLLDAAMTVFLDQGYAQTTMDRIVRAAGASTKTVYSRYRNKNEILTAAVRRLMESALPNLINELDAEVDETEPRLFLIKIGDRLATLATAEESLGIYRLVVAESSRFPGLAKLYGEGSGRVLAFLARLFAHWHESGRLPFYGEPASAAAAFLDLVVATPRNKAVIGMPLSRAALKKHVAAAVDIFLRGCGPQPRANPSGRKR
ncbi:TetR/AcrR family transcriptional regulator [Rhizobium sp. CNPSo 3490]|uniref:TetR/AcrR family transcriptional regulator n=1 Tax=Rhizobium sp. CNPSo 3490 TaxID=3021407 RepID=UPI00254A020B|nr:TetR/AcrR family transcriptional regulator [Rhizobium sp. CNPSo 3490]MDK4736947.1 TetR/AcrR family transcriptional regulator [Rhizobium sp. CNPSo 3490]